jgi:hypothetical protein
MDKKKKIKEVLNENNYLKMTDSASESGSKDLCIFISIICGGDSM